MNANKQLVYDNWTLN